MSEQLTKLTKAQRAELDSRVSAAVERELGSVPTLAVVEKEFSGWAVAFSKVVGFVGGVGRVLSVLAGESVQSLGALLLLVVFAVLEYDRVRLGSLAIHQGERESALIALAFVAANVVVPMYKLRAVKAHGGQVRRFWTVRGALAAVWRRVTAEPYDEAVPLDENFALHVADSLVLWATLGLAWLAVLGPMLEQYSALPWFDMLGAIVSQASGLEFLQLVAGVLLSLGGVMMVQSIAHEVGARVLLDDAVSPDTVLARRVAEYDRDSRAIYEREYSRLQAELVAAKRAKQKKQDAPTPVPVAGVLPGFGVPSVNGSGPNSRGGRG